MYHLSLDLIPSLYKRTSSVFATLYPLWLLFLNYCLFCNSFCVWVTKTKLKSGVITVNPKHRKLYNQSKADILDKIRIIEKDLQFDTATVLWSESETGKVTNIKPTDIQRHFCTLEDVEPLCRAMRDEIWLLTPSTKISEIHSAVQRQLTWAPGRLRKQNKTKRSVQGGCTRHCICGWAGWPRWSRAGSTNQKSWQKWRKTMTIGIVWWGIEGENGC